MAEPGTMDYVHLNGIEWIHYIQMNFKHSSEIMLILTQIGDPRYAFLIYFPLTFSLHRNTGIQVIWMSCISEWLNAVFKWILHGERPYWWIHEIAKHDHIMKVPELEQYRLTCEIGPGSPSGHAMITSAVLYTMITSLVKHKLKDYNFFLRVFIWCLFAVLMIAINISRLYIATHFPHQVVAGTITGILIAEFVKHEKVTKFDLWHHLLTAALLILASCVTYYTILSLGLDPLWSISKAQKWCARQEWVHLDTSLFFSIVRDISSLVGIGLGLKLASYISSKSSTNPSTTVLSKVLQIILCISVTLSIEKYRLPHTTEFTFYMAGCIKYIGMMVILVALIPWVLGKIISQEKVVKNS